MKFPELNNDQRREMVNAQQRYAVWSEARRRAQGYRGSLVWHEMKGENYLVRSYYDNSGNRRQTSEGRRDPDTERMKVAWEQGREEAARRVRSLQEVMSRQSAINRALRLGRVPLLGARILRALDEAGLLGSGIRVVETNAIFAYEAAAGVMVDASITATGDIDLLMDARRSLKIVGDDISERSLIDILRRIDRSFQRSPQPFRAVNDEGYLVDLIKPQRNPPWLAERERVGESEEELAASPIEGLAWHESAPAFEAVAVDDKGGPVRIVASDPRVFAAHKHWLSKQKSMEPAKRRRDAAQAEAVGALVATYLTHLPYDAEDLRMMPRQVYEEARPLFKHIASDGRIDGSTWGHGSGTHDPR